MPVPPFLAPEPVTAEDSIVEADLPGQVRQTLADYLRARRAESRALDAAFAEAVDELVGFVLGGGKRIRPTFAWWGWRAAGGPAEGPEAAAMLRVASSLELIQACALVHDDLIDGSDTRRGKPTVHRSFAARHRARGWNGSDDRFGTAAAVLLGDLALAWADDMLHSAGMPPEALARGLRPWRAMRTEVLAGQYLDTLGPVRGDETPQAALRIDELKAASYTVQRPLEIGAELAGAGEQALEALRRFGCDIGVAFQLRDDLLGVFGDPEVTGKPAGDDLREGKRTLLIAEGFQSAREHGDSDALELLRGVLGDAELDEKRVELAREALIRLGAVDAVERRITELTGTAMAALHGAGLAEPAASRLADLAVAVTDRTR
ncbi:polyprenyl synthetase family protein [Saccharopolyspora taberi]|uniref:polyprenyl synthetase family protein n=1 Tax=Saccharopolyspora taberi TaxID=60895 RepID=UPI0031CDCD9F